MVLCKPAAEARQQDQVLANLPFSIFSTSMPTRSRLIFSFSASSTLPSPMTFSVSGPSANCRRLAKRTSRKTRRGIVRKCLERLQGRLYGLGLHVGEAAGEVLDLAGVEVCRTRR